MSAALFVLISATAPIYFPLYNAYNKTPTKFHNFIFPVMSAALFVLLSAPAPLSILLSVTHRRKRVHLNHAVHGVHSNLSVLNFFPIRGGCNKTMY